MTGLPEVIIKLFIGIILLGILLFVSYLAIGTFLQLWLSASASAKLISIGIVVAAFLISCSVRSG